MKLIRILSVALLISILSLSLVVAVQYYTGGMSIKITQHSSNTPISKNTSIPPVLQNNQTTIPKPLPPKVYCRYSYVRINNILRLIRNCTNQSSTPPQIPPIHPPHLSLNQLQI